MSGLFSKTPVLRPKRNVFNLSHERKFSMDFANLTPVFVQDVLPGDRFKVNTESFIRFAPMLAPIMHRVNVYVHYFFVPNRLVMPDWEDFITGGKDGMSTAVPPMINFRGGNYETNFDVSINSFARLHSLADYFGLPVQSAYQTGDQIRGISALPFLAYTKIFNEYYRDQNLQDEIDLDYKSATWTRSKWAPILTMKRRNWEKDYFTSALPWTQKGPQMTVPTADGRLPVELYLDDIDYPDRVQRLVDGSYSPIGSNKGSLNIGRDASGSRITTQLPNDTFPDALIDPNGTMSVDLGESNSVTINDLRTAFQIQRWLERNARGGSRYVESILSHFGVKSSDARLQRPEFLGGGKSPVVISEVLQNSSSDNESPQGNMAGHGYSSGGNNGFTRFFEEHGYIIGIMSVMPRSAYQQGVPRHFMKSDRFDYFWPTLAHLGEQPVYNRELYEDYSGEDLDSVFGYQSRYCEYKYIPSTVHGDFRNTLNFWHLGRIFDSAPNLNSEFIEADPNPMHRIFAVEQSDFLPLWVQLYNSVRAARPIPRYSDPGYIDHF